MSKPPRHFLDLDEVPISELRAMLKAAIDFCRNQDYRQVYLWTFEGLDAARHLYEKAGFKLVEQKRAAQWGLEVNEQRFELQLRYTYKSSSSV